MIPSRGVARSLPSRGVWRQLSNETIQPRSRIQRLGNGRSFGTALRTGQNGLAASSPLRSRHIAPTLLAGVSTSRSLSLWGYGKKTPAVEEPIPVPSSPAEEIVQPPEPITENASAAAASPTAADPNQVDFSAISDLVTSNDVLNMPETIGYLNALGLDYGWGPTAVMQWLLEHVHVYGGLGWGASIVASAFILRAVMMYPQVQGLKFASKAAKMKEDPRAKEAMALMKQGFTEKDQSMTQKGQYMNKILKEEYEISNLSMVWNFIPIPFSFGLFRIISGMTAIPVPSLETSGFLWFVDLTARDPYFLLPIISAGLMSYSMQISKAAMSAEQRKMMGSVTPVLAVVIVGCTVWLSAAVNLMGIAFGGATLIATMITQNAAFRRAVGLQPVPTPAPAPTKPTYEAPRASGNLRERLTSSLNDAKKGLGDQVSNFSGGAGAGFSASDQEKADRKRKDMLRQLEDTRKKQEREEFERKYKSRP